MTRTKPRPRHLLVPEKLRKQASRLTVHFDFSVPKQHWAEFAKAWRLSAPTIPQGWGPYSTRADESLALSVRGVGKGPHPAFHAVVEFRRGHSAPYRKIADRRMDALVDCIWRYGQRVRVASWYQTMEDDKEKLEKAPELRALEWGARTDVTGYTTKVTGIEFKIEKPGVPPVGISVAWGGSKLMITAWTKGQEFGSVGELFDPAAPVLRIPALEFAEPAQGGDPRVEE